MFLSRSPGPQQLIVSLTAYIMMMMHVVVVATMFYYLFIQCFSLFNTSSEALIVVIGIIIVCDTHDSN